MEWVPVVFIAFKASVLAIGMFFAIKWHYDKAKRQNGPDSQRAVLWATAKVVVGFALLVGALLFLTFRLGSMLGIDLNL
jgi:hypothetical protein